MGEPAVFIVRFSKVLLRDIRPEIITSGDGIIDVHVDTEQCPAGRYYVVEIHDDYVVAEHRALS